MAMNVLVVEDNRELAENIGMFLADRDHTVDFATDGRMGLRMATRGKHDVIVLDLGLPGMDGLEVCRRLRNEARHWMPVLIVTARESQNDKLLGIAAGADDYLVKPFTLSELESRLLALVRPLGRAKEDGEEEPRIIRVADLEYNPRANTASRDGKPIRLTPMALKVLGVLCKASPRLVTRAELEREIWGSEIPDGDIVDAHISSLHSAIDQHFSLKLFTSVPGVGFRIGSEP